MNRSRGPTSPLWPIRFKPLPDELLSSWLMRIAHGHGLKVQTFCNLVFGGRRQVWNRDVDRLGPDWLVTTMSTCTGTPWDVAYGTTLRTFEGTLYRRFRPAGALQWIQTLQMYHRKRQGYGMQLCPSCLREGTQPYYRRIWRVSFNTVCTRHQCMLLDRCPDCGSGVSFHRTDVGCSSNQGQFLELALCHRCGLDLRFAPATSVQSYDESSVLSHLRLCEDLCTGSDIDLGRLNVMHHVSKLLLGSNRRLQLQAHLAEKLGVAGLSRPPKRTSVESRPLGERHHYMLLIAWLMEDFEERLREAHHAKALRYLHLGRDFPDPPSWYRDLVGRFSRRAAGT